MTPYEEDVIDINEMKNNMNKAVNALKWQYTNLLNAKLTPGAYHIWSYEYMYTVGMIGKMCINVNGKELSVSDLVQVSLPNPQTILLNFTSDKKVIIINIKLMIIVVLAVCTVGSEGATGTLSFQSISN